MDQGQEQNIRFFHMRASNGKKHNQIDKLEDVFELWRRENENIQEVILEYFSDIFISINPPSDILDEVVSTVSLKVNEEMNCSLYAPFTSIEVEKVILQMFSLKSP
ncbi:UNVERIFIED_CONTAM: hypothetical protein Slati_1930400 [Sesamum latifolium]|uniref:Uncharacterized protein n=1 Tax=Sesamum latifolium TaxID=2727402 RepID=A0AAW2X395_9LAMI